MSLSLLSLSRSSAVACMHLPSRGHYQVFSVKIILIQIWKSKAICFVYYRGTIDAFSLIFLHDQVRVLACSSDNTSFRLLVTSLPLWQPHWQSVCSLFTCICMGHDWWSFDWHCCDIPINIQQDTSLYKSFYFLFLVSNMLRFTKVATKKPALILPY
jgi:hypothetical protein